MAHHISVIWCGALVRQDAKPPVVREVSNHLDAWYRVVVDSAGEQGAHYEYRMHLQPIAIRAPLQRHQKKKKIETELDRSFQFVLTELEAQYGDRTVHQGTFGVVPLMLNSSGFPGGLSFQGQLTPFVIPLLSWYLPPAGAQPGKSFDILPEMFDGKLKIDGFGKFVPQDDGKTDLSIETDFQIDGVDFIKKRKLVASISLDSQSGEVLSAAGKYTAPDGTVQFHLNLEH